MVFRRESESCHERPDHCPHCAYDARGNTGWTCPECGEDIRNPPHASIRTFALGLLAVAGFATLLCFLLQPLSGFAYFVLVLANLPIYLNALLLPILILLNGVRRWQDGRDSMRERVVDGVIVLAAWAELGLAYLALRNSGFFSI